MFNNNGARNMAAKITKATPAAKSAITKSGLRIVALQEGGRHRAGRHWPQEETTVPVDEFSDEQIEQLLGDKKLMVVEVDLEVASASKET
jgi:hypothetical protein